MFVSTFERFVIAANLSLFFVMDMAPGNLYTPKAALAFKMPFIVLGA